MKESDILYETSLYWVSRDPHSRNCFVVWRSGITHSTACAWISDLSRAKAEANRRTCVDLYAEIKGE